VNRWPPSIGNADVFRRLIGRALLITPLLALVDWSENALLGSLIAGVDSHAVAIATRFMTGLKELLFVFILFPLVVAWIASGPSRRVPLAVETHRPWLKELRLLRALPSWYWRSPACFSGLGRSANSLAT
jgi:hypothetical protein